MLEGDGLLGASRKARKAADAVGVAHKGLVGHIDIHRACGRALITMDAGILIPANTNDTQHTQKATPCTTRASIVTEGTINKETQDQDDAHHTQRGDSNHFTTQ